MQFKYTTIEHLSKSNNGFKSRYKAHEEMINQTFFDVSQHFNLTGYGFDTNSDYIPNLTHEDRKRTDYLNEATSGVEFKSTNNVCCEDFDHYPNTTYLILPLTTNKYVCCEKKKCIITGPHPGTYNGSGKDYYTIIAAYYCFTGVRSR